MQDKILKDVIDVAVVSFNEAIKVEQEFIPVEYMKSINLVAIGNPNISEVIEVLLTMVKNRRMFYQNIGVMHYKPWIIIVTDAESKVKGLIAIFNTLVPKRQIDYRVLIIGNYNSES